jgi:hypothetical protein
MEVLAKKGTRLFSAYFIPISCQHVRRRQRVASPFFGVFRRKAPLPGGIGTYFVDSVKANLTSGWQAHPNGVSTTAVPGEQLSALDFL